MILQIAEILTATQVFFITIIEFNVSIELSAFKSRRLRGVGGVYLLCNLICIDIELFYFVKRYLLARLKKKE